MTARRMSWLEKHDVTIRELAWLGNVAGAPHPATHPSNDAEAVAEDAPAPEKPSADAEALRVAMETLAEAQRELDLARAEATAARQEAIAARAEVAATKEAMAQLSVTMCDDAERELVRLAMAVAERVVAQEISVAPELVVTWAREAIAGSALGEHFVVALAPDLASAIDVGAWDELAPVVKTDPALPSGTCEVRDGGRVVSVSSETRLALVGEQLAASAERNVA
jgi:flagellar assembly protein FliH